MNGNSSRSVAGPSRPLWRRLASAQESGLVVVIAVMMLALTVFGGAKPDRVMLTIPAGATVSQPDDTTLVVSTGGKSVKHVSESGWRIRGEDGQERTAIGQVSASRFLNLANLVTITTSASFIAVMAVGMTAIIVLAGIDLSIGSIYGIAALVGALALRSLAAKHPEMSTIVSVLVALSVCGAVGAACGFLNGFSSVALRVHPFIITLGAMAIYRGMMVVWTEGQTVSGLPDSVQTGFFKFDVGGVTPVPSLFMVLVALGGMFVLSRTVFGRRIYAIGGNETAAKYAGVPVGTVKTAVYTISGLLAGISGAMYIGYYGAAENAAGSGYELQVIAAAVIGGAALSGGRGTALGAVLGAIIVKLIENGMIILDIPQSYNQIVMGLAIIIAVVVDQAKTRLSK